MKKKDEDEFTAFIKEHKRRIYKLCYLYRSDSMGPDDLYQEVLINLWRCWGSFAGRSAMSTYVHRITLNTAFTFLRKKYREVPTCVLGEPDDLPLDEQAEDPHEDMLCEKLPRDRRNYENESDQYFHAPFPHKGKTPAFVTCNAVSGGAVNCIFEISVLNNCV